MITESVKRKIAQHGALDAVEQVNAEIARLRIERANYQTTDHEQYRYFSAAIVKLGKKLQGLGATYQSQSFTKARVLPNVAVDFYCIKCGTQLQLHRGMEVICPNPNCDLDISTGDILNRLADANLISKIRPANIQVPQAQQIANDIPAIPEITTAPVPEAKPVATDVKIKIIKEAEEKPAEIPEADEKDPEDEADAEEIAGPVIGKEADPETIEALATAFKTETKKSAHRFAKPTKDFIAWVGTKYPAKKVLFE